MKSKHLLALLLNLAALLAIAIPVTANVVASVAVPPTRATGDTITADIWNDDALGLYSYINNTLLPSLNVVTTKGDLYAYTGSVLTRVGVGTDGQVLVANSGASAGLSWATFASAVGLTNKGDLLTYDTGATRMAIGADGTVPIADSNQAKGWKWGTPTSSTPTGAIIAWSPAFAGTNTIPSGWHLCDGTSGSPNLIGKFIIGTRPNGSSATAATGGYGAQTVDSAGSGTATHSHTVSASGTTSTGNGYSTATLAFPGTAFSLSTHTHTVTVTGTTNSASTEPADYALVYIIKQ